MKGFDEKLLKAMSDRLNADIERSDGWIRCDCPFCGKSAAEDKAVINSESGVLNCKSGDCQEHGKEANYSPWDVLKKLGISRPKSKQKKTFVCDYLYHDESGNLLFKVTRWLEENGKKTCTQQAYNGKSYEQGMRINEIPVRRVLYHLPEIIASEVVYVVEGEKCADRVRTELQKLNLNIAVTTNPGGAEKWKEEFTTYLEKKSVVIFPDNDEPGRRHARQVWEQVKEVASSIKVVTLPGLEQGEDIYDWLEKKGTIEDLQTLIDQNDGTIPDYCQKPVHTSEGLASDLAIRNFLKSRFDFRYNRISGRWEFRKRGYGEFAIVTDRGLNTPYLECRNFLKERISYNLFEKIAQSEENAPDFDPFRTAFEGLPVWDGVDHISELSSSLLLVDNDDSDFAKTALRRWLVGTAAQATERGKNQVCLVLMSKGQGKHKTTFFEELCLSILPRAYFSEMSADIQDKDAQLKVAECFLICMDELAAFMSNKRDAAQIKALIAGVDTINLRRPYDKYSSVMRRHASFCGTTNETGGLISDMTGNRRWLFINIERVHYERFVSVNKIQLWSQVWAILNSGERYWFEAEEIDQLNERNEKYRDRPFFEDCLIRWLSSPKCEAGRFTATELAERIAADDETFTKHFDMTRNAKAWGQTLRKYFPNGGKLHNVNRYEVAPTIQDGSDSGGWQRESRMQSDIAMDSVF